MPILKLLDLWIPNGIIHRVKQLYMRVYGRTDRFWGINLLNIVYLYIYKLRDFVGDSASLIAIEIHTEGFEASTIIHLNVFCYRLCN